MKILYVTTVGLTMTFFRKIVKELIDDGCEVDIATNETTYAVEESFRELGCKIYQIDTSRSPFKRGNLKAIEQIKRIVSKNHYDIVHCHTPIAAMCTRIACRSVRKTGTKVIYTAHGFHFYKNASIKNWLLFYPVEKICSYFTDVLITINQEDYAFAQKKMNAKKVVYVPGVGLDLKKFERIEVDKVLKRQELGIPQEAKVLLSVGELNENKNHETVIRAIVDIEDVYYIIAGKGDLQEYLQAIINELGLEERVKLLGYRNDITELCKISDLFVFPSFREGLSVSVMEAMACGLPVACSKIRGNVDLIDEVDENGIGGGMLFDPYSIESCKEVLESLLTVNVEGLGSYNKKIIRKFEMDKVNNLMKEIYING